MTDPIVALTQADAEAWGKLLLYAAIAAATLLGPFFSWLANRKSGTAATEATAAATAAAQAYDAATTAATAADAAVKTATDRAGVLDKQLTDLHQTAGKIQERTEHAIEQNLKIESNVNGNVSKLHALVTKLVDQVAASQQESADTRKQLADLLAKVTEKAAEKAAVLVPPQAPPAQPPPRSPRATDLQPPPSKDPV